MNLPAPSPSPLEGDIVETICRHLEKFNANGAELSPSTEIASDLNIDSMAMMEMIFALEERFDVSIPLNRLGDVRTIGELAGLVAEMKAGR